MNFIENIKALLRDKTQLMNLLILASALFFVWMIWYFGFYTPLSRKISKSNEDIKIKQTVVEKFEKKAERIKKITTEMGLTPQEMQMRDLHTEENKLVKELANYRGKVIELDQVPVVMQDIMKSNSLGSVFINKVGNPLPAYVVNTGQNKKDDEKPLLYKNIILLEFRSDFNSAVEFISKLEELKWWMQFQEMFYKVGQYPTAEVKIYLQIYSTEQGILNE